MALAKKSIDVGILLRADTHPANSVEYTISLQNKQIEIVPEFWSGGPSDESIGGKKISNLRGYRIKVDISYDGSREYASKVVGTASATDSTFRAMFNDILYCFTNNEVADTSDDFVGLNLRIRTDSGQTVITDSNFAGTPQDPTFLNFVPENMSYTQQYSNQIGRFFPRISLVSEFLLPSIPSELEGVI